MAGVLWIIVFYSVISHIYIFLVREKTEADVAKAIDRLYRDPKCCNVRCLASRLNREEAEKLVRQCFKEVEGLDRAAKKEYMVPIVERCIVDKRTKNYKFNFRVGKRPGRVEDHLCRDAFACCYNCTPKYITSCVTAVSE